MNILQKWKHSIKDTIATNDMKSSISNLENDINKSLLPMLNTMSNGVVYKTDFVRNTTKEINDSLKAINFSVKGRTWNNVDLVDTCIYMTDQINLILPWLRSAIKDRNIEVEGMIISQANTLQMIDLCEFTFDYMLNLCDTITQQEMTAEGFESKAIPTVLDKIVANKYSFVIAISILGRDLQAIKDAYGRIPTVVADLDMYNELMESIGRSNADPLNLSAPPFPLSVIFYGRLTWADWQMTRLEKAETTQKAVSYRLAMLERKRTGQGPDAALDKQIEAYEDRLMQVTRKINKWEVAYGLVEK